MPTMNATSAGASTTSHAFKRRFMIRLVAVLLGGMFLDGYILGIMGPVTNTVSDDLGLSSLAIGLVAAAPLFGIFVGAPLAGWATDKFGRKPMFLADIGLFVVASGLQVFVGSTDLFLTAAAQLFIVRFLMGIAIGGEYSIGWPLMSEFSPPRLRGRLIGLTLIAWYAGFMVAYAAGFILTEYTDLSWRLILGSSTVLAVAIFFARLGLPESPRWLWNKGRKDEARAVATSYMMESSELDDIQREQVKKGSFAQLFNKANWRATLFTSGFWFCAVTPYFAIATFADSILHKYGLGGGLAGGVGLSALALLGVILTVLLIDRVGRRVLTVPPQWLCTVALAVIAIWVGAPPIIVLVLFLAFSFFNAMYTTLTGIYPVEIFPTEIRGIGTGFATAASRIGAALGTFLLPWAITNLGSSVSMAIAAVIAGLGAALSQWLAPETKGQSLCDTAGEVTH
ncbi:MFS transporter [Rhodococcus sp. NPDC056960]|uniref:MFS transporter n=1 Tax=Rhodococcus sp. NPDC056960 TaxID=3345982 RepID=UPI003628D279